uniref:Crossover junction endonuclease MUS81 n=1 Tax=Cyprinus carpio carpio TaxID=630221 RepID=A0A9J7Y963_CYPCA
MPTDQVCLGRKAAPCTFMPKPSCKRLENAGEDPAKLRRRDLRKHYRENGSDAPNSLMEEPQREPSGNFSQHMQTQKEFRKEKGAKKKREHATEEVWLTLYRHTQGPSQCKYTAWSSVSTLIQKDLLVKTHNPGLTLAEKLDSDETGMAKEHVEQMSEGEDTWDGPDVVDLTSEDEEEASKSSERRATALSVNQVRGHVSESDATGKETVRTAMGGHLPPGFYDIVLCVDFIKTTGGSSGCKQELVKELQSIGVTFDVRKLNVGDFLWVAREKVTPVGGLILRPPVGKELVLDYIIERKRMDDLCGSIIGERFRDTHKKNCTLFYRSRELEGDGEDKSEQMANLFCSLMAFTEFNYGAVKNKTVEEVFARQLMQISGVSGDKATAVLEHYSTVAHDQCSNETDKEKLLKSIKYGKLSILYCTRGPLS